MIKARMWVKKLHLWIALISAIPLVVMSLSGVMLVYKEAIDDFVTTKYMDSPVGPQKKTIEELRATLKTQFPQHEFPGVVLPPKEGRSYYFWMKDAPIWTVFYIDPYSGAFRGQRAWDDWTIANTVWWLTDLHYSFKWGTPGSWVVGINSAILALSIISGLFLWWPRKSKFDSTKFKPRLGKRWRQTAWNLHAVVGLYVSIALLFIAVTGTCITFYKPTQKLLHALTLSPPPRTPPVVPEARGVAYLPPETLIATAVNHLKTKYNREPHVESMTFATPENVAAEISFQGDPGMAWADHFHVYTNAQTGELIEDSSPPAWNRGERTVAWMGPIHFGTWGAYWGPATEQITRILWIFVAATPIFFIATGLSMVKKSFWKRKPKR